MCSSSKKSTSSENDEKRELVHSFYITEDISWQAPGRRDRIIIHETTEGGMINSASLLHDDVTT